MTLFKNINLFVDLDSFKTYFGILRF